MQKYEKLQTGQSSSWASGRVQHWEANKGLGWWWISIPQQLIRDACLTFPHSTAAGLRDPPAHCRHCQGPSQRPMLWSRSILKLNKGPNSHHWVGTDKAGNRVRKRLPLLSHTCGLPFSFLLILYRLQTPSCFCVDVASYAILAYFISPENHTS